MKDLTPLTPFSLYIAFIMNPVKLKVMTKLNSLSAILSLSKEWHPTKNGLMTPNDVTLGSHKKVWWLCKKDNTHIWEATINNRVSGTSCPFCAGKAVDSKNCLATINPKLAQEWHPTKNGSLTPYNVMPGSDKKVWWLCKKDNIHEWEAVIYDRNNQSGCPFCAGKAVNSQNCLATINPKLAQEWHPIKNGSLTPNDVTPGSQKKVWWLCRKDNTHEWESIVNNRTGGVECPYCGRRVANYQNCLAITNPKLVQEWHPTKNGSLTPNDVLYGSQKKVWWLCKKDNTHIWEATINRRVSGNGCPFCGHRAVNSQNCLATVNPKLAQEWHPAKNGSLTPYNVMPGSDKKVWWLCKKDNTHIWEATVHSRSGTNSRGCPFCAGKAVNSQNCLATINPKLAQEWHPTKNGSLTPNIVTSGSQKKVWWLCNKDSTHIWEAIISSRSRTGRRGCPYCHSRTSIPELKIYSELKTIFQIVEHRKKINRIECDIYLPELRVAIEVDGSYWHRGKTDSDKVKNVQLSKLGITLIRVRDVGLSKISELDIIHNLEYLSLNLIKAVLLSIEKASKLSDSIKNRITKYIKNNIFQGESEFVKLLNMLPSALPGTSLFEIIPRIAQEWHPTKNGSLTANDVTPGSHKKVWWLCKKDNTHIWEATVHSRSGTDSRGCPFCAGKAVNSQNCLATVNPKLAQEWHPTENGSLTPKDVTLGSNKKVWWLCNKDNTHKWEAKINDRNNGNGCPYCGHRAVNSQNCLATVNPKLAQEWHPTKNGSLTPKDVTLGSNKKVWWLCNKDSTHIEVVLLVKTI